ncbi:CP family cyanate transporter-like MFS transporter [Planomicrobium soli]|uniref:CP family cyanate transporter-like MFS transporter n=1 Tax=Planomicrobium soli TaxID=1176648 RepID=A0A2P8H6P0_9BACL|nr:MFS transporter [Planomicrobium soli]PSL41869.1 CP family cyanate transporter-like MFS transporter [Planomicrobium soli]
MGVLLKKSPLGLMVVAIFFISLNLRPAISSIGPLLETIRSDLDLTNSEVSLLTSVPVFCMGLFAPFAVWFGRRFGVKASITLLLLVIGLFTLLRGLVPTYPVLFASSFFIGLAIAIISPLVSAMIKQNFPSLTPALIGVYSFGMGLGAALSAGLTSVLYAAAGWPSALASWGLLAIAGILLWLRVEQPVKKPSAVGTEKVRIQASPWKNKRAWFMLIFFAFQSALFFSLITWLAPIAIDKGMSVLSAGAVLTLMSAVQLLGNLSIPLLLEKFPSRFLWIIVSLALGAVGILMLLFGGVGFVWAAAVCLGLTLGSLFPIALLMPLDENQTAEGVNSWTAMIQSGGYIISGTMPFVIGILYDRYETHTITLSMLLGFSAILLIFACLLYIKRR